MDKTDFTVQLRRLKSRENRGLAKCPQTPFLHGAILQLLRCHVTCHVTPLPLCLCMGCSPTGTLLVSQLRLVLPLSASVNVTSSRKPSLSTPNLVPKPDLQVTPSHNTQHDSNLQEGGHHIVLFTVTLLASVQCLTHSRCLINTGLTD